MVRDAAAFALTRPPTRYFADDTAPCACSRPQSSGVQCVPEVLAEFEQMKIRSAYGYIVFKITDDKKFIEIEKKGAKGASFDEFTKELPDGNCRYGVLDVEIQTKSGATANKLIFVSWYRIRVLTSTLFERTPHGATPNDGPLPSRLAIGRSDDNASIKPKMLYASSKDALKKSLTGINEEYQATDRGDLVLSDIQKKAGSV